jgi:hypothetical protein
MIPCSPMRSRATNAVESHPRELRTPPTIPLLALAMLCGCDALFGDDASSAGAGAGGNDASSNGSTTGAGGERPCVPEGPCSTADDCCSGICDAGQCAPTCLEVGTLCEFGASCCSGVCDAGRCAAPACRPDGATCGASSECCAGTCTAGTCGTGPTCKPDGLACAGASECCSGQCTNAVCGPEVPTCGGPNVPCSANAECCSDQCVGGLCQCKTNGLACTTGGACCIGQCDHGLCGASNCAHDACVPGGALNSGCSPCVMAICAQNPACCLAGWDASCVELVGPVCGLACGG